MTVIVEIFDKAFVRTGLIGDPISVDVQLRHNGQSVATVEIRSDHSYLPAALAAGSRLSIIRDGTQELSGPIISRAGGSDPDAAVTLTAEDDWRLLGRVLGWPNPTGTVTQQGAVTAYDTKTGPAETVTKWFVQRAVTRLGLPVTVAPDLGRGATVTVSMRMHRLADRLLPAIDQAGIGTTVRATPTGLIMDCYAPVVRPMIITPASGVVRSWAWQQSAPKMTRAIIGGQGEGTAREFRARQNTVTENEWGDIIEGFLDARDESDPGKLDVRGDLALAEGAATAGLTLELAEIGRFRYGPDLRVGDKVSTQLIPGGPVISDVLREANIRLTLDDGLAVTPVVGIRQDDPDRAFAAAIAANAKNVRNIQART